MQDQSERDTQEKETQKPPEKEKSTGVAYPHYPDMAILPKKKPGHPGRFGHMAPRWAAGIGAIAVGVLYTVLPEKLTIGPNWLLLTLEAPLVLILVISNFSTRKLPHKVTHTIAFVILGLATLGLVGGVTLLVVTLPDNKGALQLLRSATIIWLLNVLVFSLWYWELDGGGPFLRHQAGHEAEDFLFPQQANGNQSGWAPHYIDYLFLGFTGASAFSPTDTLPLTRRAKALMMIEALISMLVVLILAGRAVNIL